MPWARRCGPAVLALTVALLGTAACARYGMSTAPADSAASAPAGAETEEARLLADGDVYDDADLIAYLSAITDGLLSEEERRIDAAPIALTVLRDPTLSAFALPTGRLFLHTGLLARLQNEAQLAAILARELSHLGRRQALGRGADDAPLRRALTGLAPAIARAVAGPPGDDETAGSVLSPVAHVILGRRLAIAYEAAVGGYGTTAARDADTQALTRLQRAGYEPAEAAGAFERLRRQAHAGGIAERFFYGNERALAERAPAASRVLDAAARPEPGADAFAARLRTLRLDNARLELGAGRYHLAQEQLDRLAALHPADAGVQLAYGDLYRLRAQRARSIADRDELAREARLRYERCQELDPDNAAVHRQLGLLYFQLRRLPEARAAFARYVTLAPDAPDVGRVREYLAERP